MNAETSTPFAGVGTIQKPFVLRYAGNKEIASGEIRLSYPPVGIPKYLDLTVWDPASWYANDPTWVKRFEVGATVGIIGTWKQGRTYTDQAGNERTGKPILTLWWISQEGWRKPYRV